MIRTTYQTGVKPGDKPELSICKLKPKIPYIQDSQKRQRMLVQYMSKVYVYKYV